MKIYDFSVKNRKGEDISLENYKGKIQQHDIPKNICSNPKNEFVKQLLKMAEM